MNKKIEFDISGIYWGALIVIITVIPFLVVAKNYSENVGFLVLLLIILVLFFVYASSIFIRTYWPAIHFYSDYFIDNHRVLSLPKKIYKSDIDSCEFKETTNRGGTVKYIELSIRNSPAKKLFFDDRLTVSIDELYEIMIEWYNEK
ncbi:MAG: hypothetical protein R6U95_03340 [Bacteroidales bacterium]